MAARRNTTSLIHQRCGRTPK